MVCLGDSELQLLSITCMGFSFASLYAIIIVTSAPFTRNEYGDIALHFLKVEVLGSITERMMVL